MFAQALYISAAAVFLIQIGVLSVASRKLLKGSVTDENEVTTVKVVTSNRRKPVVS